jgi:competence protein ComEC
MVEVKQRVVSPIWRSINYVSKAAAASVLTTVVAGGFSSIAAAYHFGRMAPYGTVANGLSLPVVSLIVMPAALTSAMLMPLGLEYYPLKLMEIGLEITMRISDTVSTWPGANVMVAKPSTTGIIIAVFGATLLCVGAGRLRWGGIVVALLGLFLGQNFDRPAILIEERAANVAVLDASKHYVFADPTKGKFAGEKWLQSNGENIKLADAAGRAGWTCLEAMCFSDLVAKSVAYIHEQPSKEWTCPPVDILIADFPLRKACPEIPTRIDRFDVWKRGAHAIYLNDSAIYFETVKGVQGDRPWVYKPRARPKPYQPQPELPLTSFSG